MAFWGNIVHCATAIREFIVPSYRPERYYMRGPGPACARRGDCAPARARVTFQ